MSVLVGHRRIAGAFERLFPEAARLVKQQRRLARIAEELRLSLQRGDLLASSFLYRSLAARRLHQAQNGGRYLEWDVTNFACF